MVHLNRIFQLILHSGYWKRILVNCKPFAFIRSFLLLVETIHEVKCRKIFKEEQYSCSLKPFSWIFADIPASGSSFFQLVERSFYQIITTSVYGFCVNFKPCAFIQSFFFFCCWKALLKLGVNQFSSTFSVPNSGSSFPVSGNGFSIECYSFRRVKTDFFF